MPSPLTSASALAAARALAAKLGLRAVRSADRPGLLVGALLYPHLRDAVAMVADGYATPADVDTAMTLGCGYPRGPMRMLADAGPAEAVAGAGRDARRPTATRPSPRRRCCASTRSAACSAGSAGNQHADTTQ